MPSDTFETIQSLILDEIGEREQAATLWEDAAAGFDCKNTEYGEAAKARALAAQNRADTYRLNRLKLELQIEAMEPILK